MSVFSLLAIPFFIYAGDLMVRGGIAQKHRRLRRLAGRPSARRAGPGQHRDRDAVRRHFRLGGRRSRRGRRADDPADEGARLWRRLCRQRHLDGGADRAASAAVAQHDHLFDLGRRQDLHRRPVHGRHHSRPAAGAGADGHRLFRGAQRGYPTEPFPGFAMVAASCRRRDSRPAADRHHLRRRALGHLHRDGKLLHRRHLRAAGHRLRLPADELGRLRPRHAWARCAPRRWCC